MKTAKTGFNETGSRTDPLLQVLKIAFVLMVIGFIFYLTSQAESSWLFPVRQGIINFLFSDSIWPTDDHQLSILVDAVFHMVAYGILALSIIIALERFMRLRNTFFWVAAIIVVIAGADELHQIFIKGRDASWWDFSCDLLGMFWAFTFYALYRAASLKWPQRRFDYADGIKR